MKNILLVLLLASARMEAATVTTLADNVPGSLRALVAAAGNGETIDFAPGLTGQIALIAPGELVVNQNITINGPGPALMTIKRGLEASFRIVHIQPGKTVTIKGVTIFGGYADSGLGAGIYNDTATLTLINCHVSWNNAGQAGGGIYSNGTLTISDCVVDNNRAVFSSGNPLGDGGGILSNGTTAIVRSTIDNNVSLFYGGGLIVSGTTTIKESTISNNWAGSGRATPNAFPFAYGGGLDNSGTLTITNSTISGNTATGAETSGAGAINNSGTLSLLHSTLCSNYGGEGIANEASSALIIGNTILKAGTGQNIVNAQGATVTSRGYNLSNDTGGGFLTATGDQLNTDPLLGPLQDNGGPTFTHALLIGSPASNAGDPSFTPPPESDQRGYVRVWNGRVDIGSLESQPTPTPTPTASPSPSPTATRSPTPSPSATATPPSPTPSPTPTPTPSPTPSPSPAVTPSPTPPQVTGDNIATRGFVQTGNNVLIGGFILGTGGAGGDRVVVIRGMGPSLARSGIDNFLPDPVLSLYNGNGDLLRTNDNWQDDYWQVDTLRTLGLAPDDPKESVIYTALSPGAYTAVLAGKDGGVGVALVEIYLFR